MNKKALRKELTMSLLKEIEEVLGKHNYKASRRIRKTTREASKTVAKRFVKALKEFPESPVVTVKAIKRAGTESKQAYISKNKPAASLAKKKVVPLKSKVKK